MIKKLFIILLMGVTTFLFAQTVAPKKCSTCGKPLVQCQYKGRHPNALTGKKTNSQISAIQRDVSFNCITDRATIYVDGSSQGISIKERIRLSDGVHSIIIKTKDYYDYSGTIQVDSNNNYFYITLKKRTSGVECGHEWVNLGLSVKWATCNVGANSPEGYGGYYSWGETKTKLLYNWEDCLDCMDKEGLSWSTYTIDGKKSISPNSGHDTARENWGGTWRMPTPAEINEIINKCKWEWTTMNGHSGYRITGPNGNSIFLPAAGRYNHSHIYGVSEVGNYWSNTLFTTSNSLGLNFGSKGNGLNGNERRIGFTIRPVIE